MGGILCHVLVTVMVGRIKLSFHHRVFILLLTFCWVLVGTFMVFQYFREKEFKTELFNTELQAYNASIIDGLRKGGDTDSVVRGARLPSEGLRTTLIDRTGRVIYDNNDKTPFPVSNHNARPEIIDARTKGVGYIVDRHSESDDADYFYSARLGDNGVVVRSAAPYTHTLQEFLRADRTMLWIMAVMTLLMSFIGFWATRKISLSIMRLNRFAEKAERGAGIFDDEAFPHDELGSIASHIVRLYVQRDQRHREAMRQEQDKIRIKKQLTNNINHELKTPVASILVCLELLREHPELPSEKQAEFHQRIYDQAQRLNALLKDVAVITRLDEGVSMIEKAPVELSGLINDIICEAKLSTDIEFYIDVPVRIINGNRPLLESIFRNLVDNAIAYSGCTEIRISADDKGNFVFTDNGCGIASEHLPYIFERFYRIDKGRSRAAGGTGLGLAIVRNAVALHGGDIRASSCHGLRFDFRLV